MGNTETLIRRPDRRRGCIPCKPRSALPIFLRALVASGRALPDLRETPSPAFSREPPPGNGKKKGGGPRAELPEWRVAELGAQAEIHNRRIEETQIEAAIDYWLLGSVLNQVRENFRRGTWQPWLGRRGIELTRQACATACHAIRIHERAERFHTGRRALRGEAAQEFR